MESCGLESPLSSLDFLINDEIGGNRSSRPDNTLRYELVAWKIRLQNHASHLGHSIHHHLIATNLLPASSSSHLSSLPARPPRPRVHALDDILAAFGGTDY